MLAVHSMESPATKTLFPSTISIPSPSFPSRPVHRLPAPGQDPCGPPPENLTSPPTSFTNPFACVLGLISAHPSLFSRLFSPRITTTLHAAIVFLEKPVLLIEPFPATLPPPPCQVTPPRRRRQVFSPDCPSCLSSHDRLFCKSARFIPHRLSREVRALLSQPPHQRSLSLRHQLPFPLFPPWLKPHRARALPFELSLFLTPERFQPFPSPRK